jgi:glycosyltransferase involved in cell wall biosynthesis
MTDTTVELPKASLLLATKNRRDYLRECLQSARGQSYPQLEILVSDDGSTDGTQQMVRDVAARDGRVRLLTGNPRPGAFGNFAYLLAHATGDLVAFVGDDDLLEPPFVARLAHGIAASGAGIAYAAFYVIDGAGHPRPDAERAIDRFYGYSATPAGLQPKPMLNALRGQVWLGASLYRTELVRSLGFDDRAGSAADLDIALRAASVTGLWYAPDRLWRYRDHAATISRDPQGDALRSYIGVLERHASADPDAELLRHSRLRRAYRQAAASEMATDPRLARNYLTMYRAIGGRTTVGVLLLTVAALPASIRAPVLRVGRAGLGLIRKRS